MPTVLTIGRSDAGGGEGRKKQGGTYLRKRFIGLSWRGRKRKGGRERCVTSNGEIGLPISKGEKKEGSAA